ncbi:aldose 1-epimerase family protein [Glycomyces scopariae]
MPGETGRGLILLAGATSTAEVSPRAASLRSLRVHGRDLVEPTAAAADPPGMAGAVLAPWPNRVASARWTYDGAEQRLAVTEPEFGHANHGLLADRDFTVRHATPDTVTLAAAIDGEPGYPFRLDVAVTYRLAPDGLDAATAITNRGDRPAPAATGAHPYLRAGDAPAAALRLDADRARLPGRTHLPGPPFAVAGTGYDLREPVPFARLPRHLTYERAQGPSRHRLTAPDGTSVELRADANHRWFQLYVDPALATDDGPRAAIAVEPMTAPPDALNTGEGLHWLAPGETWTVEWGLRLQPV